MAFKNCAPFRTCDVTINDEHVGKTEDLEIVMPMYNLLESSDNYQDSTGSIYHFKRDELLDDNANVANDTTSLAYKSKLISGTDDNNVNNVKLVLPLKYLSNFFRSLEMQLVNCEIESYGKSKINSNNIKKLMDGRTKISKDFTKIAGERVIHKAAEATRDLVRNKIADKITSIGKPRSKKEKDKTNIMEERQEI